MGTGVPGLETPLTLVEPKIAQEDPNVPHPAQGRMQLVLPERAQEAGLVQKNGF